MALIHEKLYQSNDLANISFKAYVDGLVHASVMANLGAQKRITVKTSGDDLTMEIGTAIPCGLLLNELMANALEHAFPPGRSGEIHVSFREVDDGWVELSVRDNGVGFPEGHDFRTTASLGLRLVSSLTEDQLHGKVELRRAGGTEFLVRFPRSRKQPSGG
jgi:two-component sensor histidine kinase